MVTMLSPALPGCLRDPLAPDDTHGVPRLTVSVHDPTKTSAVGESPLDLDTGRDGLLYVPQSYSESAPAPLLVALHGATGSADNWTGFYDACEARGMVLLAPDSRGRTWDRVRGSFGPDVRFLDRALQHTFDRCAIDPNRVALCGFSDGASYTLSLGLSNGDLFRRLIAFSPGFLATGEPLVGTPPIYITHGERDGILAFDWTQTDLVPSLEDSGYEVTFVPFDGGHEVPRAIGAGAMDWFLS